MEVGVTGLPRVHDRVIVAELARRACEAERANRIGTLRLNLARLKPGARVEIVGNGRCPGKARCDDS